MDSIFYEFAAKNTRASVESFIVDYASGRIPSLVDWHVSEVAAPLHRFRAEFVELVSKHGLSAFLRQELVVEDVVSKGASQNLILTLLHKFVGSLAGATELVIVDPYFYAKSISDHAAYATLVGDVLLPAMTSLQKLTIVAGSGKASATLEGAVTAHLQSLSGSLTVVNLRSDDFHDRVWIDPVKEEGFLTGTSLNGLGGKYALIDYLQKQDAIDLTRELRALGLI
jgi:hypothetical protein